MKIAAFNVKRLGLAKVNRPVELQNLIKIVSRYSVVVLLEVMDQNCRAMNKFLKELNKHGKNRHNKFAMKCSKSLGRGRYKEKFVYFYRENEVTVNNAWQYEEDEDRDVLCREPFILELKCPKTVVQKLVLIPVHTKPTEADIELDALHNVVEAVKESCNTDNIMILGDFNADGKYLSKRKRERVQIFSAPYHWLIDEDADTTTSKRNDHTYDRIVVYGHKMLGAVVPDSAKPFNFQRAYRLPDDTAKKISDHYPVEVELRDKKQPQKRKSNPQQNCRKRRRES